PFSSFSQHSIAHRALHSFPTRRSSDLPELGVRAPKSTQRKRGSLEVLRLALVNLYRGGGDAQRYLLAGPGLLLTTRGSFQRAQPDRKSTRLNSSHLGISYAVFCLKKKI